MHDETKIFSNYKIFSQTYNIFELKPKTEFTSDYKVNQTNPKTPKTKDFKTNWRKK